MSEDDEPELDPGYLPEDGEEQDDVADRVLIRSAEAMDEADFWSFRQRESCKLVVLVGEFRVGKTSLIAQLYRRYLAGPYAGFSFVGSRTLLGFARRDHLATVSSGRHSPSTPRTSRADGVGYLHLKLRHDNNKPFNIVVSDRSGETYNDARTTTSLVSTLKELEQANRVCFLLDAAKIVSDDKRADYTRRFKSMIRALKDNTTFRARCRFEILTTKIDKIRRENPEHEKLLSDFEQSVLAEFSTSEQPWECHRVCAMPRTNYAMGQLGLPELVARWADAGLAPPVPALEISDAPRNIDNLLLRWR